MSIDGTYGFVYCGHRGLGIGVFLIEGQRIEGSDFAGGSYKGTAVQDGNAWLGFRPPLLCGAFFLAVTRSAD